MTGCDICDEAAHFHIVKPEPLAVCPECLERLKKSDAEVQRASLYGLVVPVP